MEFLTSLIIATAFTMFLTFPSGVSAQSAHDEQYPATDARVLQEGRAKNAPTD